MSIRRTTWHHIRRSPFHSLAALIIVTFTFLLFVSFYFVSTGINKTLVFFETKPEITIFLNDGLTKDVVQTVQNDLSSYEGIREIRFISKDDALGIYQEQNKDNPLLLEMVTADILPASFEVSANSAGVLEIIEQDFSSRTDVVDELVYQKDVVKNLLIWTSRIRYFALSFVIVLSLISFMVIFTIIGMKITSRKDEIKTSRLLGASRSYVRRPFILEGIFYGFIGSLVSCAITFSLAYFYKDDLNSFFSPIEFIKLDYINLLIVYAISSLSAIFLTLTASLISVKRYIKF